MHEKHVIKAAAAAVGACLAVAAAPLAGAATVRARTAAAAPKVTVRIQGRTRTLLATRTVRAPSGWVTRGGAGTGKCPADSAQGALNVATRGRWQGRWYASYHEYFITGILGDTETSKKYYWGLYVNGRSTSKGACLVRLKPGDRLLFKVTRA